MKIILLMGLTASGKTTVGKLLAKSLCCNFIDLDEEIVKKVSMSVRLFYEKQGKKAFQEIEEKVLKVCLENLDSTKNVFVISTGGGIIENTNAIFTLRENPNIQIFFLHNKPKILFNRLLEKAKREHSFPAFLKLQASKDFYSQIKYAKMKFLLTCKKRLKLLETIECIKVKSKGLNDKKLTRMIKNIST